MDRREEGTDQNMISNLPLLFASGYPTCLEKITESQLENFIPFMVQCSLGHLNAQGQVHCGEPEWWPEDVPYVTPLTKPSTFTGNWMAKMKEIVLICYNFHKSLFLIKFCNDLATYEHASLRFINNYNSTTSLFDRRNNKLLVTFRNENMSYDQPQRGRKCLLKQKKNDRTNQGEMEQMMVEPAPFDIYLCDNCDAELYSQEAILEHEKTCNVDSEDIILCDSPEPEHQIQAEQATNETIQILDEREEMCNMFLLNFNLQSVAKTTTTTVSGKTNTPSKLMNEEDIIDNALKRRRRLTRRSRAVHSLTRCPTIPLSSPAGRLLLRTNGPGTTNEYILERLERVERFCHAPALTRGIAKPKYMEKRYVPNVSNITYKKPADHSTHIYTFPRRQYAQRRRAEEVTLALLRRCRPISVRLKKMSTDQQEKQSRNKRHTISTTNGISSSSAANLNIKLKRDTARSCSWKISKPADEIIVDTIDLCSSDEEEQRTKQSNAKLLETLRKAVFSAASENLQIEVGDVTITPSVSTKSTERDMRMRRLTDGADVNKGKVDARPSSSTKRLNGVSIVATTKTTTTTESNNILQAGPLRSSVYSLPYYKNSTITTVDTLLANNHHGKPTMLTDTLPLSNSGQNRKNNKNLTNLILASQALKSTADLKLYGDVIIKRVSAAAAATTTTNTTTQKNNHNNNDTTNNSVSPAQWLGSAALNNKNSNDNNNNFNNNNNKLIINNNQVLAGKSNVIMDPVVPSTTLSLPANNHHVDTCTSPNLNLLQKRVIIDLTH